MYTCINHCTAVRSTVIALMCVCVQSIPPYEYEQDKLMNKLLPFKSLVALLLSSVSNM